MPDKERKTPAKEAHKADKERDKEKAPSPAWEQVLLARHQARPHTLDFVRSLTQNFVELRGDRYFGDDKALVGGLAEFEGRSVVVLGHQKGTNTKENIERNWGMPRPEGYRKALRLMQHAARFKLPILTFVDTAGAYPGRESEERGVSQAIAECLFHMVRLPVSIITLVTGEGGSGGALAISVADRFLMLDNATYSVVSPEGCATILWRDAKRAPEAAEAMKISTKDMVEFGIVDEVVPEPAGGAHTDVPTLMASVKTVLLRNLTDLEDRYTRRGPDGIAAMLEARYAKYRQIGRWAELLEDQLGVGELVGLL